MALHPTTPQQSLAPATATQPCPRFGSGRPPLNVQVAAAQPALAIELAAALHNLASAASSAAQLQQPPPPTSPQAQASPGARPLVSAAFDGRDASVLSPAAGPWQWQHAQQAQQPHSAAAAALLAAYGVPPPQAPALAAAHEPPQSGFPAGLQGQQAAQLAAAWAAGQHPALLEWNKARALAATWPSLAAASMQSISQLASDPSYWGAAYSQPAPGPLGAWPPPPQQPVPPEAASALTQGWTPPYTSLLAGGWGSAPLWPPSPQQRQQQQLQTIWSAGTAHGTSVDLSADLSGGPNGSWGAAGDLFSQQPSAALSRPPSFRQQPSSGQSQLAAAVAAAAAVLPSPRAQPPPAEQQPQQQQPQPHPGHPYRSSVTLHRPSPGSTSAFEPFAQQQPFGRDYPPSQLRRAAASAPTLRLSPFGSLIPTEPEAGPSPTQLAALVGGGPPGPLPGFPPTPTAPPTPAWPPNAAAAMAGGASAALGTYPGVSFPGGAPGLAGLGPFLAASMPHLLAGPDPRQLPPSLPGPGQGVRSGAWEGPGVAAAVHAAHVESQRQEQVGPRYYFQAVIFTLLLSGTLWLLPACAAGRLLSTAGLAWMRRGCAM